VRRISAAFSGTVLGLQLRDQLVDFGFLVFDVGMPTNEEAPPQGFGIN
jgi:hypothetical protein